MITKDQFMEYLRSNPKPSSTDGGFYLPNTSKEFKDELIKELRTHYPNKVLIIEGDSILIKDRFIDSLRIDKDEVFRMFGVPEHLASKLVPEMSGARVYEEECLAFYNERIKPLIDKLNANDTKA